MECQVLSYSQQSERQVVLELKKKICIAAFLAALVMLVSCGNDAADNHEKNDKHESDLLITDYSGREISFETAPQRVASLSGSFGEIWVNAGGSLVGTTEDALSERNMDLPENTAIVGTIKDPSMEALLACEPDFVIMSADITSHAELGSTLDEAGIAWGLFHVEYFDDYLNLLKQFTALTGREDLYEENGLKVQNEIDSILSSAPDMEGQTALFLRAYSSGFKAKDSSNMTGTMLADFGFENILDKYDTIMEDISMEEIIETDPDWIFVATMGSSVQAAIDNLESTLTNNPAWGSLTAIKEGRYHILPQELFHYKPNARWNESYQYLCDILNGERK